MFTAWEKVSAIFDQVDRHNLDRRMGVIGAFLTLKDPSFQGIGA